MKLIFAQGNPGEEYRYTRHNFGFLAMDCFAEQQKVIFQPKAKFHADIAELTMNGEKVLLVKPTTFYNETGKSARAFIDFYKLDPSHDMLVLHDELALPFGTIRVRASGSPAGNNGIKSLNQSIGEHYHRVRLGIWQEQRSKMTDVDFVIGKFSSQEREALPELLTVASTCIHLFIQGVLPTDTQKVLTLESQ